MLLLLDHRQLSQGWGEYLNVWWNSVHFAVLLAFLVVGDRALADCGAILHCHENLRRCELAGPRRTWSRVVDRGAVIAMAVAQPGPQTRKRVRQHLQGGQGPLEGRIESGEQGKIRMVQEACASLQDEFPALGSLFLWLEEQQIPRYRTEPPSVHLGVLTTLFTTWRIYSVDYFARDWGVLA
jgi:hypothetical protein